MSIPCVYVFAVRSVHEVRSLGSRAPRELAHSAPLPYSLGSLCKGALLAPLAQLVLAGSYLSLHRPSNLSLRMGSLGGRCCCCCCCSKSVAAARKHHRLALCLCAAYGRTFCRAAEVRCRP